MAMQSFSCIRAENSKAYIVRPAVNTDATHGSQAPREPNLVLTPACGGTVLWGNHQLRYCTLRPRAVNHTYSELATVGQEVDVLDEDMALLPEDELQPRRLALEDLALGHIIHPPQ